MRGDSKVIFMSLSPLFVSRADQKYTRQPRSRIFTHIYAYFLSMLRFLSPVW